MIYEYKWEFALGWIFTIFWATLTIAAIVAAVVLFCNNEAGGLVEIVIGGFTLFNFIAMVREIRYNLARRGE